MAKFDEEINHLDSVYEFSCAAHQVVSEASDEKKLLVCERGPLLFVFNFHPEADYTDLKVCPGIDRHHHDTVMICSVHI